jgi:hypothetical protein
MNSVVICSVRNKMLVERQSPRRSQKCNPGYGEYPVSSCQEINRSKNLCVTLCLLCGSLCNYAELHRGGAENRRGNFFNF